MATDYGYYGEAPKRKSGGGLMMKIIDLVMLVITYLAAVGLIVSLLSQVINPNVTPLPSFFGLVYPIIYIVNVGCALWWVVRWRRHFFLSLLILLIGLGGAKKFFDPQFKRSYDNSSSSGVVSDLRVMSFNVMGLSDKYAVGESSTAELVARFADSARIDLLCMQEFQRNEDNMEIFENEARRLRYSVFRNMDRKNDTKNGLSLIIMSAYPIVDSGTVGSDSTFTRTLWADVKVGSDTLRVVTNHLQSTSISKEDRELTLTPQIVTDSMREERLMGLVGRLSKNYKRRADQADSLAQFVATSPYPIVVCGDLNDTPISYVYRTVSGNLTDSFVMRKEGNNATFNGFMNLFRIDYVFIGRGETTKNRRGEDAEPITLIPRSYISPDVQYSDHYPVVVGLDLSRPKAE